MFGDLSGKPVPVSTQTTIVQQPTNISGEVLQVLEQVGLINLDRSNRSKALDVSAVTERHFASK